VPALRMGPPPRSFAADAHACIMVRVTAIELPHPTQITAQRPADVRKRLGDGRARGRRGGSIAKPHSVLWTTAGQDEGVHMTKLGENEVWIVDALISRNGQAERRPFCRGLDQWIMGLERGCLRLVEPCSKARSQRLSCKRSINHAEGMVATPGAAAIARSPATIRQPRRHTFSGMDETQTLALQALRELLDNPERADWDKLAAASRALIKAIETGQSARRLADVIMIDRNAAAAAEIATLRRKLAAAEARIQIEDKDTAFNPLRERIAALNCEIAKWWSR
jgi:hypothetical protein